MTRIIVTRLERGADSVPDTTEVIAGDLLDGGGPLTGDVTLDVNIPDLIAAVAAALVEGANMTVTYDSGTDTIELEAASGGGGSTDLLGVKHYSAAGGGYTTTSSTLADVDATNLAVTFTAPSSGKVLVRQTALASSSNSEAYTWGVRNGTSDIASAQVVNAGAALRQLSSVAHYITGLTGGASYTFKWSHSKQSGGTGTMFGQSGIPACMEIWAAP